MHYSSSIYLYLVFLTSLSKDPCLKLSNHKCVQCQKGFVQRDGYCISCPHNCLACEYSYKLYCTQCMPTYFNYQGQCQSCGKDCLQCININNYYFQPSCLKCSAQSQIYESQGRHKCKQVVNMKLAFILIGSMILFILVLILVTIRCINNQKRKDKLNSLFQVSAVTQQYEYNQNQMINYSIRYKNCSDWKDIPHKIKAELIHFASSSHTYSYTYKDTSGYNRIVDTFKIYGG